MPLKKFEWLLGEDHFGSVGDLHPKLAIALKLLP
jgi:hypothetical protein